MLNEKQLEVVEVLKKGENVLLIGQAGTGKSKLLKELSELLPEKQVYLTSTTGISALNIGGVTMHSFLGIGTGDKPKEKLLPGMRYRCKGYLAQGNPLLCIDEVSMLSLELFEKLDWLLKKIRGNAKPFGGLQILLSGDFLQLEPINQALVYKSELMSHFKKIILTHNYRQENDVEFQNLLDNLRLNKLTENDLILLENACKKQNKESCIKIFCLNKEINQINENNYKEIQEKEYTYQAIYKGEPDEVQELKKQFMTRGIDCLKLKKGLKVMLIRNESSGLVNGSIGIIEDIINRVPLVRFGGILLEVKRVQWEIYINGNIQATASQLPLTMAYASSVHKCQGMSIDKAEIDLKSAFCNHQIYVALSRVRTYEGLYLKNFNPKKIKVNKETLEYYEKN